MEDKRDKGVLSDVNIKGELTNEMSSVTEKSTAPKNTMKKSKKKSSDDWDLKAAEMVQPLYNEIKTITSSSSDDDRMICFKKYGEVLDILDSVPKEEQSSTWAYWRGKLANALPGRYNRFAELHLLESVKHDHDHILDAYLELGLCYTAKGDYVPAESYFKRCIGKEEKVSPTVLRGLAELELKYVQSAVKAQTKEDKIDLENV